MLIVELEDEHEEFKNYSEMIEEIKALRDFIHSKNYIEIYKDSINTVFVTKEKKTKKSVFY